MIPVTGNLPLSLGNFPNEPTPHHSPPVNPFAPIEEERAVRGHRPRQVGHARPGDGVEDRGGVAQLVTVGEDIRCGDFDMPVSESTATHHFRVLREAGLIRQYYVGTSRMNALRRAEMDEAFPGLLDALTPRAGQPAGRPPA